VAERLAPGIRATDAVAAAPSGDTVSLLLVDAEATDLPTIMERLTPRLEELRWSAGGACFPRTATTAGELLSQAQAMMKEARRQGVHRLQLPN
jgi:GGDEF domain-containing protein